MNWSIYSLKGAISVLDQNKYIIPVNMNVLPSSLLGITSPKQTPQGVILTTTYSFGENI
jgi:hypothetical protein